MRMLMGLVVLLASCSVLPEDEVLCNATSRCAAGSSGVDGGPTADLRGADLSMAPMPCSAGGGTALGGGVYACPGAFGSPGMHNASQLCGPGHVLCTTAGTANLTTCGNLSGYFLANVYAVVDNQGNNNLQCNVAMTTGAVNRAWAGCGKGGMNPANSMYCGGFQTYLDCGSSGSFSCMKNGTDLNMVMNTSASNGVLCCGP